MPDYTKDAVDARAQLKEDGGPTKVRVYTDIDYNENTGDTIRQHKDTTPVYGAMFDFFFGAVNQTGTEIEKGDKRLYLANDVVINDENKGNVEIEVGDIWYKVIGVREINPQGTFTIMYDLHLRKLGK